MFRSKRRGRHAAPTPTSTYVVRGALIAGATPAFIGVTSTAAHANTGEIPLVEVQASAASTQPTTTDYTVKSGDTLAEIAADNGTTWQALAQLNGIANPNVISIGQDIKIQAGAAASAPVASGTAAGAYANALTYLGVPYEWGGESRAGVDCSGLVLRAYQSVGVNLPRGSADQARYGTRISESDARVGDLVAFRDSHGYVHHVGLYAGDGNILHAPRRTKNVQVSKIWRSETVEFYRIA